MKVMLDGAPLTEPTGGITRYVSELSRALGGAFPEDEYWLVSDQVFRLPAGCPGNVRQGRRPSGLLRRRWWSLGTAIESRRLGAELFHGTDFAAPYLPVVPSVLTLHDLSPWKQTGWHHTAGRVRRRTPYLLRLGLATMVITPSESIRREAIERFHLHPGRVTAVPLAAAPNFRPVKAAPAQRPYFLYLGTVEPRKNIPLLLEAWRQVRKTHPVELVVAGRRRPDGPLLAVEPGLRVLGEVPEEELPRLYSGAAAVLYPSFYEGFGLPVLEAMRCGAAVFASPDAAIREITGNAALHLDVGDVRAWVEAMTAVLERPGWRAELGEAGLRRSAGYSWDRTARLTRAVYQEAMERFEN